MLRRLFPAWSALPKSAPDRRTSPRARLLGFDLLEAREVPSVTLATISEPNIPTDKPIYIPVTVTNTPTGPVTTTVSANAGLTAEVLQGGRSIRFDVSGTDASGVPFSGSMTLRLFEADAPLATQRLIDLVTSGYYVGKTFPRLVDGFVIQGGETSTSGNSPLPNLPDEFTPGTTFASRGLLAMANSGDDTENSQFFITDIDVALAGRPTHLNYQHTIAGILTDGFDIYQKIITTTKSGESPTNPITITGATVFTDTENAVVKLTPTAAFGTGTAGVTVTANDGSGPTTQSFNITGVADGVNSRPFVSSPVPDQTTTAGTPVTFTVPTFDEEGDALTLAVKNAAFTSTTIPNATVSINQATKQITVTPAAGFTGTIQFKVGVRETSASDTAASYDTQLVTLVVNPAPAPTTPPPPGTTTSGPITAQGSAAGAGGSVTVRNADGSVRFTVPVFGGDTFTGGVRVAVGDVNDDGVDDVVAVPGFGFAPTILVLDSTTGAVTRTITVFEPTFLGGLHVQVGDAAGLGYDQVLVGAGEFGGPRVTLLDLKRNQQLLNFFAGDVNTRGGVDVDVADVFQGKGQMIVTGSGPGPAATVALFNASTGSSVGSFSAGSGTDGIRIRVGEMTSGVRPIFVAPLAAADGVPETEYDPSAFIDPNKPAPGSTTTTSDGSNFDLSSLFAN